MTETPKPVEQKSHGTPRAPVPWHVVTLKDKRTTIEIKVLVPSTPEKQEEKNENTYENK